MADSQVVKLRYPDKVPVGAMREVIQQCLAEEAPRMISYGDHCSDISRTLSDLVSDHWCCVTVD
jgi:hypothetical protein